MGTCTYCGQSAGFLRRKHGACKRAHREARSEITALIGKMAEPAQPLPELEARIDQAVTRGRLDAQAKRACLISGFEQAVEHAFADGILSAEEEAALGALTRHFALNQSDLDRHGSYTRLVKGTVLRDLLEGRLPERVEYEGTLPFNLQKTEALVWLFQDVDYYTQKKRVEHVGGSQGVSIRIAKGVYYRTGAFKGRRIETMETIRADQGLLAVTNRHLYFKGQSKSFRIRLDRIVSFEPFVDGIGLHRDSASSKPESFRTGDGWFTYNLVSNVAQL